MAATKASRDSPGSTMFWVQTTSARFSIEVPVREPAKSPHSRRLLRMAG
jgi:hypothetical protein